MSGSQSFHGVLTASGGQRSLPHTGPVGNPCSLLERAAWRASTTSRGPGRTQRATERGPGAWVSTCQLGMWARLRAPPGNSRALRPWPAQALQQRVLVLPMGQPSLDW